MSDGKRDGTRTIRRLQASRRVLAGFHSAQECGCLAGTVCLGGCDDASLALPHDAVVRRRPSPLHLQVSSNTTCLRRALPPHLDSQLCVPRGRAPKPPSPLCVILGYQNAAWRVAGVIGMMLFTLADSKPMMDVNESVSRGPRQCCCLPRCTQLTKWPAEFFLRAHPNHPEGLEGSLQPLALPPLLSHALTRAPLYAAAQRCSWPWTGTGPAAS